MAAAIEDKCQQLWNLLKKKAPTLGPKIIVRGYDDDQLLALCRTDEQKAALESTLDKFSNSKRGKTCSICQESVTESGGTFASEWDFDFDKRAQILTQLSYLCEACYSLTDLEELLPLLSKPNANILSHIERFHTINGISSSDLPPVSLVEYMEQCYSAAFALRVILANFPTWSLVDMNQQPFSEDTDFALLAQKSLSHIKKTTTAVETSPKPALTASPKSPASRVKSNLFELDNTPRKNASPKRKLDSEDDKQATKKRKH